MKKKVKIGYEIGTGEEVHIEPAHLVVTGITQQSGKTTLLNALIKRGKFKAVVFKTKIGEKGITEGRIIPPYYKDEFDWEYASEILEASRKEKLKFERSWIIKYAKKANNLTEFKANIDKALADDTSGEKRLRGLEQSVLITLQAYLEKILPELQYAPLSNTLDMQEGVNIMDLEKFKDETQGLVIRSVITEVLNNHKKTIVVIPEAWKHLPERLGSPVKRPAEAFIRQGAANNNFLFLDSQDITGVSKTILKQVSIWILGYQREINEIKRTLDQIPLPKKMKPKPEDIATLAVGHFFVATSKFVKKVYVQPSWLDSKTAKLVALGKKSVEDIEPKTSLSPYSIMPQQQPVEPEKQLASFDDSKIRKELVEIRHDFFNKISEIQAQFQKLYQEIYKIQTTKQTPVINEDEIVSKVLQKVSMNNVQQQAPLDMGAVVSEVLKRVPSSGNVVYEVAPLEKIRKDFLQEAKDKILGDVGKLSDNAKKALKYIESKDSDVVPSEIITKCFLWKVGGYQSTKMSNILKEIITIECVEKTKGNRYRKGLRKRINALLENHGATEQETEQVHNHILMELI